MNSLSLTLVRNAADLIESFVRHHLPLVNLMVLVDNGSDDGTREILEALRQEGLPLLIVDHPVLALSPARALDRVLQMVTPVFHPEVVLLLDADCFVQPADRPLLDALWQRLPERSLGQVPVRRHLPSLLSLAQDALAQPLAEMNERVVEPTVLRSIALRLPAAGWQGLRLAAAPHALPAPQGPQGVPASAAVAAAASPLIVQDTQHQPLPQVALPEAWLAWLPVRTAAQLATQVLQGWHSHAARHAGLPDLRERYAWKALADRLLAGEPMTATLARQAALCPSHPQRAATVAVQAHPLPPLAAPLRHGALARPVDIARIVAGLDWPALHLPPAPPRAPSALDLAPLLDLCAATQARSAIVMGPAEWAQALRAARPALHQHVPRDDMADPAVDLLLMPELPLDALAEIIPAALPQRLQRVVYWPAQGHQDQLDAHLQQWQAQGWAPDMLRTLSLRALSSYRGMRHDALVLGPVDSQRPERAAALRQALCAMDAETSDWTDPPPLRLQHPLQALLAPASSAQHTPPQPAASAAGSAAGAAIAPAAPVVPPAGSPRSVFICGSGRSGTSCLAGLFDPRSHHHADNLYKPQVSNPKGFFEAAHINDLNEALLRHAAEQHLGADATRSLLQGFEPHQLWLARFPDDMPARWTAEQQAQIAAAVARPPFCLKDPRMSITLPAWLAAAPQALVLSIHRPPEVTAESILKECRVATYLLDFRISARDALALWRQSYRRLLKAYRQGGDVLFLQYDDLFNPQRLAQLEQRVGAPLRRDMPEKSLNRTTSLMQTSDDCKALNKVLDAMVSLSFEGQRTAACQLIDRYFQAFPDTPHRAAAVQARRVSQP